MNYYFKRYLVLDTIDFYKDSNSYIFMTSIGNLYNLSFTNQRAYYYKESDLGYEDKTSIFSVEGANKVFGFMPGHGYQRRTSDNRLKSIANYLITKGDEIEYYLSKSEQEIIKYIENLGTKSFFPNNIIVSMNNERYHNFDIYRLFLDESKVDDINDFTNFKDYILNSSKDFAFLDDSNTEINLDNKEIELCRVDEESKRIYIPIFELDPETSDDDIRNFLIESLSYSDLSYDKINEVREQEKYYKIAWIIDGQHRTMSLKFLDVELHKLKNNIQKAIANSDYSNLNLNEVFDIDRIKRDVLSTNIAITTYMKSSIQDQANIFIDINNNAKPVDKSLTYDLLPLTETSKSIELAAKKIFDDFNKDPDSPFYNFLYNIRSQDVKEKDGNKIQKILSQANFINEIKIYFRKTKSSEKIFFPFFKNKDLTPVYWIIYSFFSKINEKYLGSMENENGKYDDKKYALYRTTGFGALLQFMVFLLEEIKSYKGEGVIKNYDKDSLYNPSNELNKLFQEGIDAIVPRIGFTRNELSSFRGKGGQNELAEIMKIFSGMKSIEDETDLEKREKIEGQMRIFN